jgi:hypothetical protein
MGEVKGMSKLKSGLGTDGEAGGARPMCKKGANIQGLGGDIIISIFVSTYISIYIDNYRHRIIYLYKYL